MKKELIILILLLAAAVCQAQTKPEIKPSVTFTDVQLDKYLFRIDSLTAIIIRSDMMKTDRNFVTDKLTDMRMDMLLKFKQQNPPKKEEVKIEKK